MNGGLITHQPSQNSVAGTREDERKGERSEEGRIAGGYWWRRNHLLLERRNATISGEFDTWIRHQ